MGLELEQSTNCCTSGRRKLGQASVAGDISKCTRRRTEALWHRCFGRIPQFSSSKVPCSLHALSAAANRRAPALSPSADRCSVSGAREHPSPPCRPFPPRHVRCVYRSSAIIDATIAHLPAREPLLFVLRCAGCIGRYHTDHPVHCTTPSHYRRRAKCSSRIIAPTAAATPNTSTPGTSCERSAPQPHPPRYALSVPRPPPRLNRLAHRSSASAPSLPLARRTPAVESTSHRRPNACLTAASGQNIAPKPELAPCPFSSARRTSSRRMRSRLRPGRYHRHMARPHQHPPLSMGEAFATSRRAAPGPRRRLRRPGAA